MSTHRREYARGTYVYQSFPLGIYRGGAALCADGKVRKLKRVAQTADTFFSVPASVTVRGKTVAGFISFGTASGLSTPTTADPARVEFHAYTYRKNGALLAQPEVNS